MSATSESRRTTPAVSGLRETSDDRAVRRSTTAHRGVYHVLLVYPLNASELNNHNSHTRHK